jgi:type I restriction enzyme S subunit
MNTLLLEHFDQLISTPEDVERLNRSILQLAINGNLNTQDPRDLPASQLLNDIHTEKEKLATLGKISREEPLPKIQDKEIPSDLPNGWVWTRVGEVCTIRGGKRIPKGYSWTDSPTKHIYIRVTDMKDGTISDQNLKYITDEVYEFIKRYIVEKDDLYITIAGTIGAVGSVPEKFHMMNLTENAARITPYCVDKEFLKYALSSQFVQDQLQDKVNQMAQPKLALTRIKTTLLALPPLAEQGRIVTRVEELFAQTRLLAQQLADSRTELDRLNESALAHLLASETPEEFNERWGFIAEHFDLLTSAPEHIAPLRQSILELAVRGKLTRREAGDESAKELLKRIKAEKNGKGKPSQPISDDEKPFKLPTTWEWARITDI